MVQLGINTLMYLDAMKAGTPQSALIGRIAEFFPIAEVRREFIAGGNEADPAFQTELCAIRDAAASRDMTLYYSVPEDFCTSGTVNPNLKMFLAEATALGASGMKFAVGDVPNTPLQALKTADEMVRREGVAVCVENDQTASHGSLEWAMESMQRLVEAGASVKFCYDCGNWVWAGVDPNAAFDALLAADAIGEYQIKNVNAPDAPDHPAPALLKEGTVDWAGQIRRLPELVPVTLEYPSPLDRIDAEVAIAKRELA